MLLSFLFLCVNEHEKKGSLFSISMYFTEELKTKMFAGDHKLSLHKYHKRKYYYNTMLVVGLNTLLSSTSKFHHLCLNCNINISLYLHSSCESQGYSGHDD